MMGNALLGLGGYEMDRVVKDGWKETTRARHRKREIIIRMEPPEDNSGHMTTSLLPHVPHVKMDRLYLMNCNP